MDYISSAGLRVILMTVKELQNKGKSGPERADPLCAWNIRCEQFLVHHPDHRHRRGRVS